MRLRAFCAALPGAREDHPWGHPHWKVADKIFFGYGEEEGHASVGFKTEKEHQRALIDMDPRFSIAPYVGKHGWVSMKIDEGVVDWPELEALILGSYRMIAPARLVAALDAGAGAEAQQPPVARRMARMQTVAETPAAKKRAAVEKAAVEKTAAAKKPAAKRPAAKKPAAKKMPAAAKKVAARKPAAAKRKAAAAKKPAAKKKPAAAKKPPAARSRSSR